jgi:hypothetical protein
MALLIGIDEAGYGPNLGPLVITATAWRVPGGICDVDLYELLGDAVTRRRASSHDDRIAVADSKRLYQPGGGLAPLERGVLAALGAMDRRPADWLGAWDVVDPSCRGQCAALPWHDEYNPALPVSVTDSDLRTAESRLRESLNRHHVRLAAVCSAAVFPRRFNDLVDHHGGKGAALSALSLNLLAEVLEVRDHEPALAICDKHGGRNAYGPLLQRQFPEWLVEVCCQGRAESIYRWGPAEGRVEVRFCVGGEAFLPTALASMTCKYLRELAMRALNEFWRRRVPGLTPTAGYPVDARRFKTQIAAAQRELGIDDRTLWRAR